MKSIHEYKRANERIFVCHVCGKGYKGAIGFNQHKLTDMRQMDEKLIVHIVIRLNLVNVQRHLEQWNLDRAKKNVK